MSGIAGIFNRDGRPVDRELFTRTLESISHRGPDGNDQWVNGNIALGHQMMWTTPEAHHETQPLVDENKHFCLVMDGRVDNRAEVKKALADAGYAVRKDTDADIMLRAYECWGEAFPFRIVGDFAVAIWDARKRHLFCTRDVFGVKPFYYGLHGNSFIFSSEIRSFFTDPTFPCEPNEGVVGEFLANALTSREETLYQKIYSIIPAHSLLVDSNGITKQRYWEFDGSKEIRYRTDTDYAAHFLALFTDVLTQHLRSDRPVGADLSGGLDSSAIVCLAHSLSQKSLDPKNDVETFSLIFPGQKEADESKYIEDVVQMWGVKANMLAPSRDVSVYAKSVEHSRYFPSSPNGHMMDSMKAKAQEKGIRVMLTGIGGDEFLTGSRLHCADLLRCGRFFEAYKRAKDYRQVYRSVSHPLLNFGVLPLLKPIMPAYVLQIIRTIRHGKQTGVPFAPLTSGFTSHIKLSDRICKRFDNNPFSTLAQQDTHETINDTWLAFRFEMENRTSALFELEYRHPLHDRRIAEFCLAIPEKQRWRGTQTKFILRQAMRGLLPESVRLRSDKAEFSHVFPQVYEALNGEGLSDSLVMTARDWVDGEKVQTMYQEMMQLYKLGTGYPIWQLWMMFGVELWLRKIFSNQDEGTTLQPYSAGLQLAH